MTFRCRYFALASQFTIAIFLAISFNCSSAGNDNAAAGNATSATPVPVPPVAYWAKSVSSSSSKSLFFAAERDSTDSIYAVGYQQNDTAVDYGSGVTATASANFNALNAVLVKYSGTGTAQWARTVSTGFGDSSFSGVTLDSSDNIYAVGFYRGNNTETRTYGAGVTAVSPLTSVYNNAVIVKYNSAGTAQWARTLTAGGFGDSKFLATRADASGIYAVGFQNNSTATWAAGVTTTCSGTCALLVKYNSSGVAQWAISVAGGYSYFSGIALDASSNILLAGTQKNAATYTYGAGVTATSVVGGENAMVAKFSSAGVAQWARTVVSASSYSEFYAVATDTAGNLFAAGYQFANATFTFATGITTTGPHLTNNIVLVKYDSSGNAQWARTLLSGTGYSVFTGIAVDGSGDIYCAGQQYDTATFNWGNNLTTKGKSAQNPLIIKYNGGGTVQWARTSDGVSDGHFYTVALDLSGAPFVAGMQQNGTFSYGTGVSVTGVNALGNGLIVKYYK